MEGLVARARLQNTQQHLRYMDRAGRVAVLFKSEWALRWAERNSTGVQFRATAAPVETEAEWAAAMR